ncbi:MAG TPA: hypothetical protein ENF81_07180 [Thermotogaceae bacterium]|nr:hypothetical protein [Thermotogaceae bacterium]
MWIRYTKKDMLINPDAIAWLHLSRTRGGVYVVAELINGQSVQLAMFETEQEAREFLEAFADELAGKKEKTEEKVVRKKKE